MTMYGDMELPQQRSEKRKADDWQPSSVKRKVNDWQPSSVKNYQQLMINGEQPSIVKRKVNDRQPSNVKNYQQLMINDEQSSSVKHNDGYRASIQISSNVTVSVQRKTTNTTEKQMDVFSSIVMEDNTRQCAEITNHWKSAAFNQNKAIGSDQLHGQTLC